MKAFFYTLVLCFILVASTAILQRIGVRRKGTVAQQSSGRIVRATRLPPSILEKKEAGGMSARELYEMGMEYLNLWHFSEAISALESVVEEDSSFFDAIIGLVDCYSHPLARREKKMEYYIDRAMNISSSSGNSDTVFVSSLRNLFLSGAYEEAVDKLRKVVGSGVGGGARFFLARALFKSGELGAAQSILSDLLREDETQGRSMALLVRCLVAGGDLAAAEELAKELASLYPEQPYPYVLLSQVELLLGNIEEATEFCRGALVLEGGYAPAILAMGYLYCLQGNVEASKVSFEKLLLFDDPVLSSVANEAIAYVDFLSGDFDEAVEKMDEAIRLAMNTGSVKRGFYFAFQLVDYLCELGQGDAAKDVVDRWMYRFDGIPAQLGGLRIGIYRGDLEVVKHSLEEVKTKKVWRRSMRLIGADYEEMLALALIKENRFKEAMSTLSGSRTIGTNSRSYFLGYAAFESGDAERAGVYFDEVLGSRSGLEFPYHGDPIRYVQAFFYLAEASIARGDREKAEDYYTRFLDHWGDTDWNLPAVERAGRKLDTLSKTSPGK